MARFGEIRSVGLNPTPSNMLPIAEGLAGVSTIYGDPVNAWSGTSSAYPPSGGAAYVGFTPSAFGVEITRHFALLRVPIPINELSGHSVAQAILNLAVSESLFQETPFPAEILRFNAYVVRVALDIADFHWVEYDDSANLAWGQMGGKPDVDHDSTTLFSYVWTIDDHNATVARGNTDNNPTFKTFPMPVEAQRAIDRNKTHIDIIIKPTWSRQQVDPTKHKNIRIQNASANANVPHTWLYLVSNPSRSFYGAQANAELSINLADYKDPYTTDFTAHFDTGTPQAGSVGPWEICHVANMTPNQLQRNVIITGGAWSGTVRQPAGSVRKFKFYKPYNNASGRLSPTGDLRIVPWPLATPGATTYRVYYKELNGSGEVLLQNSSGATELTFSGDHELRYPGSTTLLMGIIHASAWDLSTAILGGEEWNLTILGDARPDAYLPQAADRHWIAPYKGHLLPAADDRADVQDDQRRKVSKATMQQLWDTSYTDDYGGVLREHIPVLYAADFVDADSKQATIFRADETLAEHFTIHDIIPRGADMAGDIVIATTTLSARYDKNSHLTTGVYLGKWEPIDRGIIASTAIVGSTFVNLKAPIRAAAGTLELYGTQLPISFESKPILSRLGTQVNFATGLAYELHEGDLVMVATNNFYGTFFASLRPEEGALRGEQLALIRAMSAETL